MSDANDTPQWRPAFHFTPRAMWMNDPNGLVYAGGVYHLHYQYHPHSAQWGPMHWGHATSTDGWHWTEQPLALAPDAQGMVFSGCIVIDHANTSGLGTEGVAPWVALYTQHAQTPDGTEAQALAFSLDQGRRWQRPGFNPVLPNPGEPDSRDFRDPKVFWHAERQRWVMALAVGDHIRFYASANLRQWTLLSRFGGPGVGAHGGVWECPDLFPLQADDGRTHWVLLVSLNPGGPNGGSGTQVFMGQFDGEHFHVGHRDVRWLDHGPDHYAGVTWHGVSDRVLLTAWMGNWRYASDTPTAPWRGAMTAPRVLRLQRVGAALHLAQRPDGLPGTPTPGTLSHEADASTSFTLRLGNAAGDELRVGFDADTRRFFIDRSRCGEVGFHPGFAERAWAPRISTAPRITLTLVLDACSVEVFADDGLSALTALVFPRQPLRWLNP